MSALKPCPYCGGDATLFGTTLEGWVGCTNRACPAQPSVFPKSTGGKDIAAAWNTRAADTVNAHLIAAAPDMATVLEYYADQFCEGFCKDLPQAGTYQTEMDLDCSGCKARAALAKARGQA